MEDVKKGSISFDAAAFMNILLIITHLDHNEDSKKVFGCSRNWVCPFLKQFPLLRYKNKKTGGYGRCEERINFLRCCLFDEHPAQHPDYNYNEESTSVLGWSSNWVCAFQEHFPLLRYNYTKTRGHGRCERGLISFDAAALMNILLNNTDHCYNE